MPYISKELTKSIREELKLQFSEFRFSVRNRNHTGINVIILSAPYELRSDPSNAYESVNHYHFHKHYHGKGKDVLTDVLSIITRHNETEQVDADYGSVPKYYVRLSIGSFDKPFKVTPSR